MQIELIKAVITFIINIQTFVIIIYNKFKVKRLLSFNKTKETFQRFFIKIRYYYRFYNQNLPFNSNKIQNTIANIIKDTLKKAELLLKNFFKNDSDY